MSLTGVSIAINDAARSMARELDVACDFKVGFIVVASTFVHAYFELVEIRLTYLVVLIALPENVLRGGPLPLASFALASVAADEVCGMKTIGGANAPTDDDLKKSVEL